MSRFILIAVLALVMLLVGASVVLAQDAPARVGHRMVEAPVAATTERAVTTPEAPDAAEGDSVCPMGGPGGGMGSMMGGASMMNGDDMRKMHDSMQGSEEMQQMHDSMQGSTIEEMRAACQDAWERNQTL